MKLTKVNKHLLTSYLRDIFEQSSAQRVFTWLNWKSKPQNFNKIYVFHIFVDRMEFRLKTKLSSSIWPSVHNCNCNIYCLSEHSPYLLICGTCHTYGVPQVGHINAARKVEANNAARRAAPILITAQRCQ